MGAVETSPSGRLLAYSVDGSGYETYNIRLKDLTTGAEVDEEIRETGGSVAWVDEATFFYTRLDAQHRPWQVWRHAVGTPQAEDVKVFVRRTAQTAPPNTRRGAAPRPRLPHSRAPVVVWAWQEDPDELFNVGCWASKDASLLFIEAQLVESGLYRGLTTPPHLPRWTV